MSVETLLLFVMIIFIVGTFPAWSYSKPWGYAPMGALTLVLVIFLVWALASDRPLFRHSMGQNMRDAGRDAAADIRHAVQ